MDWPTLHQILFVIQRSISFVGVLIIFVGVISALYQCLYLVVTGQLSDPTQGLNTIRLRLARVLTLGLEFIVASDLIGTTTAPDYYTVGILAIIVIIRTVLSFSLNRELASLNKE